MYIHTLIRRLFATLLIVALVPGVTFGQQANTPSTFSFALDNVWIGLVACGILLLLWASIELMRHVSQFGNLYERYVRDHPEKRFHDYLQRLNSKQMTRLIQLKQKEQSKKTNPPPAPVIIVLLAAFLQAYPQASLAQGSGSTGTLFSEAGIIITLILLLIPILAGGILMAIKIRNAVNRYRGRMQQAEADRLAAYLRSLSPEEIEQTVGERQKALAYQLTHRELSGDQPAIDEKGLLQINGTPGLPVVALKKKAQQRPQIEPALSQLILWYFICATGWLLFGTTVGEYLGIKFVAPDADQVSWLSFGRLRPVHTNAVFWGWASLSMLGLGYYIVPRVSNAPLASVRQGWYALILINAAVVFGSICLLAGINNGGGEYREYTWPVMVLFGLGLALTLSNFLRTIASRTSREIYISNWYIVSAIIFALVITLVAYIPFWQNGLGETIVQGYYMHQGVGMWFMLFTLGIVYYVLPQQLNKPIYSYSLGILAFWTQILFYTLIGTHHFVFSSIPWWLQTVAIVGSAGMAIPVIAGTTNFLMTFKGAWYKIKDSYTLPFFLVGIIFYFTGSMQGTAEAFRYTNLIWHFTDFTVAHSHLTMYGIICFFVWAGMYALIPRLTGREAPQITVGAHFWLALIGLLFYTVPLMYGSTLRGLMWMEGRPFIESVTLMAPYWLWRAIGGSLMWISHLFFAYNLYRMIAGNQPVDINEAALKKLEVNYQ